MTFEAEIADTLAGSRGSTDPAAATANRAVVLGIGNVLLGDDGAGIHVIERLGRDHELPADVELLDGGTLSFSLLDRVESASILIVVDASNLGEPPGAVRFYADEEMDAFLASPAQRSVHDLNLGDLLRMCALRDALPARRFLVGIQPGSIDWQGAPGAEVDSGIEEACQRIRVLLEELMP